MAVKSSPNLRAMQEVEEAIEEILLLANDAITDTTTILRDLRNSTARLKTKHAKIVAEIKAIKNKA